MKLVLGGYAQGKLEYVLEKYHLPECAVWDGIWPDEAPLPGGTVVINHFHLWVRSRILEGGCPEEEVKILLKNAADCIIICDEIGNGIVPLEPLERDYRERVGRILIWLAREAEEVERVLCGIGQRIK